MEYREERSESKQPVKKIHIPLKLKSKTPIVKLGASLQKSTAPGTNEKTSASPVISTSQNVSETKPVQVEISKTTIPNQIPTGIYQSTNNFRFQFINKIKKISVFDFV